MPNEPDKPPTGFPEPPGEDPEDRTRDQDPHHVLNNPATDPDPTEWPDPYDKRPDPRDPANDERLPLGDDMVPRAAASRIRIRTSRRARPTRRTATTSISNSRRYPSRREGTRTP
jgi:hypothetical protein